MFETGFMPYKTISPKVLRMKKSLSHFRVWFFLSIAVRWLNSGNGSWHPNVFHFSWSNRKVNNLCQNITQFICFNSFKTAKLFQMLLIFLCKYLELLPIWLWWLKIKSQAQIMSEYYRDVHHKVVNKTDAIIKNSIFVFACVWIHLCLKKMLKTRRLSHCILGRIWLFWLNNFSFFFSCIQLSVISQIWTF